MYQLLPQLKVHELRGCWYWGLPGGLVHEVVKSACTCGEGIKITPLYLGSKVVLGVKMTA
ncbi:hypothetical protein E2C01_034991 [Portunus trituberculatus]|uniref:Uncharacterized protein n=1 Tax=Portunus trituberculatus TaxID=210409 RepID=A0A5B7F2Z9_PORTR|nr:hypothetical protein [Portunus trituberculatus]